MIQRIKAHICILTVCVSFICDAKPFLPSLSNEAKVSIEHVRLIPGLERRLEGIRKPRDVSWTLRNVSDDEMAREPNPKENHTGVRENNFINSSVSDSDSKLNYSRSGELLSRSNITSIEHDLSSTSENTNLESISPLNYSTDSNVDNGGAFSETSFPSPESSPGSEITRLASTSATVTAETHGTVRFSLNDSNPEETTTAAPDSFKNTTAFVSGESSAAGHDLSTQSPSFNGSFGESDVTVSTINATQLSSEYSTVINATNDHSPVIELLTTVFVPTTAVNKSDEFTTNQINETSGEDSVCSVCQNCTDSYIDRIISDVTANLPPFLELPNRQGRFQLYHGKLLGLGSLKRSAPAIVACKSTQEYAVMVPLRIRNAKAFYKWQVEMPLRTFYGDLNVTVANAESRVFYSHSKGGGSLVDNLKITALDDVETEVSGMGPMNEVFAGAASIAIGMFRRSIATTMENTLIHVINKELQDVKKYEEYYEIKE